MFVLDRLLEEDGVTGDQYGPYDPAFVASERERLREDKVRGLLEDPPWRLLPSMMRCMRGLPVLSSGCDSRQRRTRPMTTRLCAHACPDRPFLTPTVCRLRVASEETQFLVSCSHL